MSSFLRGWSPVNSVRNSSAPSPSRAARKAEPPPTDEEMQQKMQYMISLQYAAQEQANPLSGSAAQQALQEKPFRPILPEGPVPDATASPAASGLPPPIPQKGRSIISVPHNAYAPATSGFARETANMDGVGQGHIYFPSDYPKSEYQPMLSSGDPMLYYGDLIGDKIDDPDYVEPKHAHHHHHNHHSLYCCSGVFRCLQAWRNAETLHRSFCYAAIDGMLTGAAIVAAFCGMGIVTSRSSTGMHLFVVAFSLASCSSDAICMALGHVWSTYVLANASAIERRTERQSFEQNRADAKIRLVDMLLSRGMLKIDAMSIADTLEGYPDIFVNALVGDSGYALGDEPSDVAGGQFGTHVEAGNFGSFPGLSRVHAAYGRFNEWVNDPEAASVKAALGESRIEAVVMMLSFALFSVLPSLIFLWLSHGMNDKPGRSGDTTATSMSVSLTSLIMMLLGIWKSKFFDSNWIMFGIETVVVFLMCVVSAYSIGVGLVTFIPALDGLSPIPVES